MAGYSDSEVEAAVSRFVQSNIRIERDALGPVDVGSKFNEVLRLISSTLIYDPNAIFYVIFLATNKLNVLVETAIEYVDDLSEAIDELGNYTKDITRTTLLGDAAAALLTVDRILTDNNAISSRAFTRYQQAVDDFIGVSLEPNIKQSGQIRRPPQLARQSVLTSLTGLSTAYGIILSTLAQIRLMLSEFNGLNLGVLSVQDSVQKIRSDLRTLQSQFEDASTTRDDKIALCRAAYLSMAAGKSVLNNFTTVSDPSAARLESSTSVSGRPEVPGTVGELVSASVTCTNSAPWEITDSINELKVTVDAGSETSYVFTAPSQPSVTCIYSENYDIPSPGIVEVDGLPVSLTSGVRTALQVADEIDSGLPAQYAVVDDGGYVKITKTTPGATELRMTADADTSDVQATYAALGFYEGQTDTSTGLSVAEAVAAINAVGEVAASVVLTRYEHGDAGEVKVGALTVMEVLEDTFDSLDHAGDMLLVRSGVNVGYRRIVSVTRIGGVDRVTVDSSTPFKVVDAEMSWIVLSERLKLTSISDTLATAVTIGTTDAASVNDIMGFTPGKSVGTTTGFRAKEDNSDLDFSHLDVVVGDVVNVSPGSTVHEVQEISQSNYQLEMSPPLDTDLSITSFSILSAAAVAYAALIASLEEWDVLLEASKFQEDIAELERVMNPLIANKNPALAQLQDARNTLQSLSDLLTNMSPSGLAEVLVAFQVSIVPRIDAALKMLKERGLDRAYNLLMDGKIEEFFGMSKDEAASSSYMLLTMRGVVQSDLRVSKSDEDVDDVTHDELVVGTDSDYDYSDADLDENIKLLGEVPDYDNEDDAKRLSKIGY